MRGQRVKDRIVRVEQCEEHFASLSGEEIVEVAQVAEHSVAVPVSQIVKETVRIYRLAPHASATAGCGSTDTTD